MVGMGMGKKVKGRDGCEPWRSAKLVHADREGGDEPMKRGFSRHQCQCMGQVRSDAVDDSARRGAERTWRRRPGCRHTTGWVAKPIVETLENSYCRGTIIVVGFRRFVCVQAPWLACNIGPHCVSNNEQDR